MANLLERDCGQRTSRSTLEKSLVTSQFKPPRVAMLLRLVGDPAALRRKYQWFSVHGCKPIDAIRNPFSSECHRG